MTGKANAWGWGTAVLIVLVAGIWAYQKSFEVFTDAHATPIRTETHHVLHEVQVHGGAVTPKVSTDEFDFQGNPVEISCSNCHATRVPNVKATSGADLDTFHQGLIFGHGNLSCLSCHHAENYDALRLADGTQLAYEKAMTLCAQCHGPQHRDYQAGSHGGMTGHWNLGQGGRVRNHCLVCHDPHLPMYPPMMPVFPPKDVGHKKSNHENHF